MAALSPDDVDSVSETIPEPEPHQDIRHNAQPYDFRRPDRIAKDQLRSIHLLHENFARTLASSLSAYLRAYVAVNLVSVEQLSFMEFSQCLPSPTCLVSLGMKPFEGNAVLEINPALIFPIIEMLLGGNAKSPLKLSRELTEIEQTILDGLYRIIMHDLKNAWQAVTAMEFSIESRETDPQLLQILAPNEAVVAVSIEIRAGDNAGMMNIGIPSIVVKMLRHKFDQQWSVRRSESTEQEHARVLRLIKPAALSLDGRLQGPTLSVEDLMALAEGDVLAFDFPVEKPLDLVINGKLKFRGNVVTSGRKRAFQIDHSYRALD
ncbi:MAG: flagellar motor switch protein FliM [Acidobacteriota bacterium]|nr:flagellar motor switch protein FliM [Acidobacteriota bacterium]